ncbi:hypothetical protein EHQ83_05010 [Leptospira yasudae]|uniref:Uncharacterized protein n=1 Tax=Leptospira yasudae TaxID=2202201 RepID=A0A6N4QCJ0_9LEPT|nr:hypothetical protein EHQ72_16430 [Leptospira yasudae]TGL77931.1 hypothetical protein EHQ77_15175 [Leptospira yasudae]TGL87041.1 hypothetical protein EHQ83_05010 [Leptospira yasudae]
MESDLFKKSKENRNSSKGEGGAFASEDFSCKD